MVTLVCALVGVGGSAFAVDIEGSKLVSHLKKAIKAERSNRIRCDADELQLFLAQKDGAWLESSSDDVKKLKKGKVTLLIKELTYKPDEDEGEKKSDLEDKELQGESSLQKVLSGLPDPSTDQIHVLVVVPEKVEAVVTEERLEFQPHPNRLKRWADLNEVLDRNKKAKLNDDGESSAGYSYVSYNEVEKILRATSYEQQSKDIPDADIDVVYAYLLRVSKVFGAIESGKEAKRLHFIAPILVCVSSLFDGDVQILVEESVEGKRVHGHGFFEFVIQRGMKRVCIVEAKRDDFQAGIAQNLVGCEALADIERLNIVFGIVTNYKEWFFFRSLNERIERDEAEMKTTHGTPTRESVKEIAEKIYAMLSEDD